MRQCMAEAEVGDDVLGDDPTVNRLQEEVAALFGTEDALFLPTGTMSNQVAIKALTQPGEEVLCDEFSHIFLYEGGALGLISGVQPRILPARPRAFDLAALRAAIRTEDVHHPRTALIALENTHNYAGGLILDLEALRGARALAHEHGAALFLDGARIFNASVASGIPLRAYAAEADLLAACLSKGLGCPAGSVLVGSRDRIRACRRLRKVLGGGMRQVGILAAAGRFALEHRLGRLAEDHALARSLAQGLAGIRGVDVRPDEVETNIVLLHRPEPDAAELKRQLQAEGILCSVVNPRVLRFVTHRDVGEAEVARTLRAVEKIHHPTASSPPAPGN